MRWSENVSEEPNSSLPIPKGRSLRRQSQAIYMVGEWVTIVKNRNKRSSD